MSLLLYQCRQDKISILCIEVKLSSKFIIYETILSSKMSVEAPRPTPTPRKQINILLLGETGVGKSTFINAFANYLMFETMREAKEGTIKCLIPCSFTLTDDNFEEKLIELGKDANEVHAAGESATQRCRQFVFPFSGHTIRLIDTPGVGDTRGVEQDKTNFDNILAFIGKYKEIHCICILLKPNNARINVTFEYCIKQLLAHLQKSASRNITFLFTNSRSTFYKPGDTGPALKKILNQIKESQPHVIIPYDRSRLYCMDNEAFRFLVATKQGMVFADDEFNNFAQSWSISMGECRRLMSYIIGSEQTPGLEPHLIQDTVSVNEARRIILSLSQPLAEIAQNIDDNLKAMERHRKEIERHLDDKKKLEQHLYIPTIELELIDLDQPRTVCSSATCITTYPIAGMTKVVYKQVCCDPCGLYGVTKEVLGDPSLRDCTAMDEQGNCMICTCSFDKHLHIYYETCIHEKQITDEEVNKKLVSVEEAREKANKVVDDIRDRSNRMRFEMRKIMRTTAMFAHFLRNNAIVPQNDSFEKYLKTLMENQKTSPGVGPQVDTTLDEMLKEHHQLKAILDNKDFDHSITSAVSVDEVFDNIKQLYSLELYGQKIKESQEKQKRAQMAEIRAASVESKTGTIARLTGWLSKKIKIFQ